MDRVLAKGLVLEEGLTGSFSMETGSFLNGECRGEASHCVAVAGS